MKQFVELRCVTKSNKASFCKEKGRKKSWVKCYALNGMEYNVLPTAI